MTINERIRELRFFVGKNQQEFATQLGLKQSMLSRIENGTLEMPTDALGELFRIYQVHPNWLFFGEGDVYLNKSNDFKVPPGHILLAAEDLLKYEKLKEQIERLKNMEAVSN